MKKLALLLAFTLLAACSTASRMGNEVSGWFSNAPAPGQVIQGPQQPQGPALPPGQVPPQAPQQGAPGFAAPGTPILSPADPAQQGMAPQAPVAMAPAPLAQPIKVAFLLPLSGAEASLGKNLLNGAELAVMELGRDKFELMPRDSGTSPQHAALAAEDAIRGGAQLIIGPLFSASVESVKPVARAANVPVLALSNDWNVAGNGAWVLGFSPVEQVQRIAAFAAEKGYSDIAILAPSSLYGDLVVATAKAKNAPVNVVAVARYTNSPASIQAAVEELAKKRTTFKALLLPEGGTTLHQVASQLSARGMTGRQLPLLGTGLWDEEKTSSDFALIGGWYAVPDSTARPGFQQRYEKTFGVKPARLASLAYDATALALALAGKAGEKPFHEAAITNPNGFAGIDGIFRLTPLGTAERGLAVMEVTKGGATLVAPAPKRF